jgi:sulfonate transport system substrate-binding protein
MLILPRRHFLVASAFGLLAACARKGQGADLLKVGDQRGGQKVVLAATGALDHLPYHVEWSAFPNAAPLLEALDIGAIDTGYGGDAAFVFAVGSGARIKAIGAQKHTGQGPVVVVRGDSPVRSLDQLAGLRIATPRGSIAHNLVLAALEAAGKPLDAAHFAFLSPHDGEAALKGRSVDAWAIWDPNATLAAHQGARILPGGEGLVPAYTLEFSSERAIADKRALLQDFSDRLYRGWQWAADHPDAHARFMEKETGLAAAVWSEVAQRSKRPPAPVNAELIAAQQRTADRYHRAGLLAQPVDIAKGFDTSFHPA